MARLWESGLELQSATAGVEVITVTVNGSATFTIDTTTKRSGNAALRTQCVSGTAGASYFVQTFSAAGTNGPIYARAYIYVVALPAAISTTLSIANTAGNVRSRIRMATDGTLELWDNNAKIGSSSSALNLNAWYRLELSFYNNTGSTKMECDARLYDSTGAGGSFASTTTSTNVGAVNDIDVGNVTATTGYDWYWDDIAINDTSGSYQNSWAGDGKLVLALPTAAGDNAATAGIYSYINEIPPSDTATAGGTDIIELDTNSAIGDYNMTDSSTLGINSYDTINLVSVIARVREESAGTSNYTLRLKSASGGTVSASSSVDAGNATVRTNPNSTTAFGTRLVSYTDPTTASAWTPTGTNSIDNMQVGAATTDGNPDIWVLWLGAYIDYTPGTAPVASSYVGGYMRTNTAFWGY